MEKYNFTKFTEHFIRNIWARKVTYKCVLLCTRTRGLSHMLRNVKRYILFNVFFVWCAEFCLHENRVHSLRGERNTNFCSRKTALFIKTQPISLWTNKIIEVGFLWYMNVSIMSGKTHIIIIVVSDCRKWRHNAHKHAAAA